MAAADVIAGLKSSAAGGYCRRFFKEVPTFFRPRKYPFTMVPGQAGGRATCYTGNFYEQPEVVEPIMPTREEIYDEADRLKDQGKLDEAVAKLQEALQVDPNYALAHSALAVVYGRMGRHDDAIRHGLTVCQLEPNDPFSYTAMSVTYVRAGKIPEAEDAKCAGRHVAGTVRN